MKLNPLERSRRVLPCIEHCKCLVLVLRLLTCTVGGCHKAHAASLSFTKWVIETGDTGFIIIWDCFISDHLISTYIYKLEDLSQGKLFDWAVWVLLKADPFVQKFICWNKLLNLLSIVNFQTDCCWMTRYWFFTWVCSGCLTFIMLLARRLTHETGYWCRCYPLFCFSCTLNIILIFFLRNRRLSAVSYFLDW